MRCAVTAMNAGAMSAIVVVVALLWSAISISIGARWVPGHCACLAQPGLLVYFYFVLAVAGEVTRLRALDAHPGLQALLC